MNTTLTLHTGSFYFNAHISLFRGVPQEVDVSPLKLHEKQNLLNHIKTGSITSSEDLGDIVCELSTANNQDSDGSLGGGQGTGGPGPEEETEEAEIEEEAVPGPEELRSEEVSEEDEDDDDDEEQDKYSSMNRTQLRAEIKRRGIDTKATRNSELRAALREADKKESLED